MAPILLALAGCMANAGPGSLDGEDLPTIKSELGKADASAEAVFVDFEFSGEVYASASWNATQTIEDQLLYTVGQLNGERSVGRLDRLEILDVNSEQDGDRVRITYQARMPVAWNRGNGVPSEYELVMPRDMSYGGQDAFVNAYKHSCVDSGAHDVTAGIMWYYYRPDASRCRLDDEDVVRFTAQVSPSEIQTSGKYPEYDLVWQDDELRVVAIFGKNEDGSTSDYDAGVSAYNSFVQTMKRELREYDLTTEPADVPSRVGVSLPEVAFFGQLPDGRRVEVVAILIDGVRSTGPEFDARYGELSRTADLIAYNGHSGLGANIRALARKGDWQTGQYTIVFMNGCDTYAYVDSALADAHAEVNPDDPNGTKYLDIVMNAMPSYFSSNARGTTTLVTGLLSYDDPLTYEQMFRQFDTVQVVLVSGEQDNTFQPGGEPPPPAGWDGMEEAGRVAAREEARFETPTLEAGSYVFELTGTDDADLYVRIGMAPSQGAFDCRPYLYGSRETCRVELSSPAAVHLMVRGWAPSSDWELTGRRE